MDVGLSKNQEFKMNKSLSFLAVLASLSVSVVAVADDTTSALSIQRTSCTNHQVSVNAKTNKASTEDSTALQTAAAWKVRGYSYSLVYYFNKSSEKTPSPVFAQLQSSDLVADGGTISSTQSRI